MLIVNVFLSSCEDEGYSLGDFYGDFAVVYKSGIDYTLKLDDGAVLYPSYSNVPAEYLEDKDRVIVNYTILGDADSSSKIDYWVKVNDIYKILTKNMVEYSPEISDSLGYDPVIINDVWIRNGYINFDFFFGGGEPGIKHMVNLVRHPGQTEDKRIWLEFRHNAFEDAYNYKFRGLVAFPTDDLVGEAPDSVFLRITYSGYEKEELIDLSCPVREDRDADSAQMKDVAPFSRQKLLK